MRFKKKVSLLFCVLVALLFLYLGAKERDDELGDVAEGRSKQATNQDLRRLQVQHPYAAQGRESLVQNNVNQPPQRQNVNPIVKIPDVNLQPDRFTRKPSLERQPVAVHIPRDVNGHIPVAGLRDQRRQPDTQLNAAVPLAKHNDQQIQELPQNQAPRFKVGQPNLIFDKSQLRGPAVHDEKQIVREKDNVQNVQNVIGIANQGHYEDLLRYQQAKQPPVPPKSQQHQFVQIPAEKHQQLMQTHRNENIFRNGIHVSVVACGDRASETLIMLKSAVIFTRAPLYFHIFAEDELHSIFTENLESWPEKFRSKIHYDVHSITFPPGADAVEWKKLFKPCASQRLFLPDVLTNVDSLLYVDTDVLFLFPLDEIWDFFSKFNETQLAAMTPEHEAKSIGWYNRFAQHPYYGETGVNSGVMLMNLTRIRKFDWTKKILPIYKEYKLKITWGDQDLLNILFHYHPELLYVYACEWNYRPDHCMYSSLCKRAEDNGIKVVHGNRGVFHNEKQMSFRSVYEAVKQYKLGDDVFKHLIEPMTHGLYATKNTPCGKLADAFLKTIVQSSVQMKQQQKHYD